MHNLTGSERRVAALSVLVISFTANLTVADEPPAYIGGVNTIPKLQISRDLLSSKPVIHGRLRSLRRVGDIVVQLVTSMRDQGEYAETIKGIDDDLADSGVDLGRPFGMLWFLNRDFPPEWPILTYMTKGAGFDEQSTLEVDGIAFESDDSDYDEAYRQLAPAELRKWVVESPAKHDLEVIFTPEAVPQAWRNMVAGYLRQAEGQSLRLANAQEVEPDRKMRTAFGVMLLQFSELAARETKQIRLTANIHADSSSTIAFHAEADADSGYEQFLHQFRGLPTRFAPFRQSSENDTLIWSFQSDKRIGENLATFVDGVAEAIAGKIRPADLPSGGLNPLLLAMRETCRAGRLEGFAQLVGEPRSGLVALGAFDIQTSEPVNTGLVELLQFVCDDDSSLKLETDAENYAGVRLHRIEVSDVEEFEQLCGGPIEFWIGCDRDTLWWATGGGDCGLELMHAIDLASSQPPARIEAGIELKLTWKRWLAAQEDDDERAEWTRFGSLDQTGLKVTLGPTRHGARFQCDLGAAWSRYIVLDMFELGDGI